MVSMQSTAEIGCAVIAMVSNGSASYRKPCGTGESLW
jgi:hypothetical protein